MKENSDVQYLVIPVKKMAGRKTQSRLPNENNLENKVQAFLKSVGLENAFLRWDENKSKSDSGSNKEFDLFAGLEKYREKNDNSKSGWSLAFWFGTGSSWPGGAKPKDRLTGGDKTSLLKAAQAAKDGIQHG